MFDTFTQNYTPPENEYVSALFAAIPGHYTPQDPSVRAGWIPEALERNNAYAALEAADALFHRFRGDRRQRPLGDVGREIRERTEP
jgi:hypothetical protein